ncbi:MAG: WYL domain-containing protein [Clostridia bacterium]|nr:WYL domain-containing protein [Clostridia bacterium]
MAYSELVKNFGSIRAYLRSFYVYGFQHRNEYDLKSARSYDNERRRVESWLGDYMRFGQDAEGRRVFLSVDSRAIPENPLYRAFRAKSFTDRDIMLHFHLLDLLSYGEGLPISAIMEALTDRLSEFEMGELPDESTVRKKLSEYCALGLIRKEKRGRETCYACSRDETDLKTWDAAAAFFSEAAPLGVVGSYLRDRLDDPFPSFRFKHHYILNALDSEILAGLFAAMAENRPVSFFSRGQWMAALPLKIYIGAQTGRQYLLSWSPRHQRFSFHRIDLMEKVKMEEAIPLPESLSRSMENYCSHAWGVTSNNFDALTHVEMTVRIEPGEDHILSRLKREKRCGEITQADETHWRFSADLYEAPEILPFLRSFIGRITALKSSDPALTERFFTDLKALNALYGSDPE